MIVLAWNFFEDIKKNNSDLSDNFINNDKILKNNLFFKNFSTCLIISSVFFGILLSLLKDLISLFNINEIKSFNKDNKIPKNTEEIIKQAEKFLKR